MTDERTEFKPGEECPVSGIWVDLNGKEVALSKVDRLPPTDAGETYHLVQATHHETTAPDVPADAVPGDEEG
jgi:hypothetical protein